MENAKLSIIIPVYNSEAYLEECVASIQAQTYQNLEIILVDDGAKDASPEICDRLKAGDDRILVIHKENGGTSSARNAGLDAASGDYITFMDNDDYFEGDTAIAEIMAQLEISRADILFHENTVYWQDTDKRVIPTLRTTRDAVLGVPMGSALSAIVQSGIFSLYCVWSKVIRAGLIQENGIRFPEGMRNEDTYFCGQLLLRAKTFDLYEKSFYMYRKGHAGAQTLAGIKYSHLKDLQQILGEFVNQVKAGGFSETEEKALLSYIAFPYSALVGQSRLLRDNSIKDDMENIKSFRYLFDYDLHPSVKKVKLFYKFFGFRLVSLFLAWYIKKTNHLK